MKIYHHKLAGILLALLLPMLVFVLVSCRPSGEHERPADVDYYTCTMHPSVRAQDPTAKCPICSMSLVPVMKKDPQKSGAANAERTSNTTATNDSELTAEFSVAIARQQQIGVTQAVVEKKPFRRTIRTVGSVAVDKQRHWDYVSRVEGYVEKLFVFSRGEKVSKNAPLLTLYSPDLLTTQNEYVDVLRSRDELLTRTDQAALASIQQLVDSAKQRLRLWNLNEDQIAELEKTRKPQEYLTLTSPFSGVVQDISVDQGRRVMPGDHLVDLADLSVVWVWAQFYESDLELLKQALPVTIFSPAYPKEKISGKISIVDPFIDDTTRTARVRIDVNNAALKLRPEMFVNVELQVDMGEGLAVPVPAVLPAGDHNLVFLDRGDGKLEPRYVELGHKYGDVYEVVAGLKQGDRVVTSANFLIDAEAKVQGALKSW